MVRQIKRKWRRFYRTHREGCELVGDFIGAVSIFVFLFELYIIGVMLEVANGKCNFRAFVSRLHSGYYRKSGN